MNTYKTSLDGRDYEVETTPENVNQAFNRYCSIYRIRKDGSRGLKLLSHRPEAWAVYDTVSEQAKADEA